MHQLINLTLFVFTLISSTSSFGQLIWEENFDIAEKGFWADSIGNLHSDLSNVNWTLDVSACNFSDEKDYAKTVSTAGGRFEVIDSDGELTWISDIIDLSNFNAISISFDANETGSSSVADKKYIKAFYKLNKQDSFPFQPQFEVSGNWGSKTMAQKGIAANSIQLFIKMNSSYANDKVIIDNIKIEAVDSSLLEPSKIKIIESPLFAFPNDTFLLTAAIFNKMDEMLIDSNLQLELVNNTFSITNNGFNNGFYIWEISSELKGEIPYAVFSPQLDIPQTDSAITFMDESDIISKAYFEDTSSPSLILQPEWIISDYIPISGKFSIKHKEQENKGRSALSLSVDSIELVAADYFFSFQLKNGDWDPSSSNSFYFLMTSDREQDQNNGYAVGVNAAGSSDLVSFWKVHKGQADVLLAETALNWEANQTVQFNILRKAKGEWTIIVADFDQRESYSCNAFDNEFSTIDELQLIFNYTATRSGKLWFDNLLILKQNSEPFISEVKTIAENKFQITFNEAIRMDLIETSNINIVGNNGKQYAIRKIDKINTNAILLTTETIDEVNLKVIANTIHDLEDKVTSQCEFHFEYTIAAEPFDIVFSELMVDPTPTLELPETEYIELYNRSYKNIQLDGWILNVRDKPIQLPRKIIQANEYIILCDTEFAIDFKKFGTILQLEKFPSLLNSGTTIQLISNDNNLIEEINYSDEWYFDKNKENGGYSLERIDINRICGQRNNWTASASLQGGTPGKINSNNKDNTDNIGPEIAAIEVSSTNSIIVFFNEALDSISARNASNFSINNITISKLEYSSSETRLKINLASALIPNKTYQLNLSEIADECGNITTNIGANFVLTELKKGDILINEILFNPFLGGADFVELYNNSGIPIDLNSLKLSTRDNSLKLKSIYNISDKHIFFANEAFIALTNDTFNIITSYEVPSAAELIQMPRFPSYNNDEGRVVLLNDSLDVIDEFYYNENMHSEWLSDTEGVSLERISLNQETNITGNWFSASSIASFATPGFANSQGNNSEEQIISIEFESDIVSPNGDGYNDELIINFIVNQTGYLSNIYIFSANGTLLKRISNNDLIGNNNQIRYDLRDKNGTLIPLGTYFVLAELLHFELEKVVLKKAFHVTDRL